MTYAEKKRALDEYCTPRWASGCCDCVFRANNGECTLYLDDEDEVNKFYDVLAKATTEVEEKPSPEVEKLNRLWDRLDEFAFDTQEIQNEETRDILKGTLQTMKELIDYMIEKEKNNA